MNVAANLFALISVGALSWADTVPRALPAEYPVQSVLKGATLAAEYGSRAISQRNDSFYVSNYLVVEVAFFPEKGRPIPVTPSEFRLRLNQSTRELATQSPGLVAAALRNPNWEPYRGVQAGVGVGPGDVVIGGPPRTERFPGDPQARRPTQPKAPEQNGSKPSGSQSAGEAVEKYALEPGPAGSSRSGLIYFYWPGKIKELKSIYLVYDGAAGKTVLRLR